MKWHFVSSTTSTNTPTHSGVNFEAGGRRCDSVLQHLNSSQHETNAFVIGCAGNGSEHVHILIKLASTPNMLKFDTAIKMNHHCLSPEVGTAAGCACCAAGDFNHFPNTRARPRADRFVV